MLLSMMLLLASPAEAGQAGQGFGIGGVLGEPSGLSMAWRDNQSAIQTHLSWSVVHDHFRGNLDYLQTVAAIDTDGPTIPFYVGIGGIVAVGDEYAWFGGRVPLGVALHPREVPLEGFLEFAPALYVLPETDVGVEGALGLRIYL